MNPRALFAFLPVLLILACVAEPEDDTTGNEPLADAVFAIDTASAPTFMDANLDTTNAVQASFVNYGDRIAPAMVNSAYPAVAGMDADLLEGVGFGTYPNPEYTIGSDTWEEAGSFRSVLTADVMLSGPGDVIRFCRSMGTTCVSAVYEYGPDAFTGVIVTQAANLPDTHVGEVLEGVTAAIHGTGDAGLTVALSHPDRIRTAVDFVPDQVHTLEWVVERGAVAGSLDYAVAVDGEDLMAGSALLALMEDITMDRGVVMMFDAPVTVDAVGGMDYGYDIHGEEGTFTGVMGTPVDASPQPDMANAPLYLYPTVDPGYELLTYVGDAGEFHTLQFADGVVGYSQTQTNPGGMTSVYSQAFNGDDFAGTPLEGLVDQGTAGGGFYPSVPFCYSQIYPLVRAKVEAGLHATVHQMMYANIANGVGLADSSLPTLAAGLAGPPFSFPVSYTPLGDLFGGDVDAFADLGTDFADNNVDTFVTTPLTDVWTVVWTDARATTFVEELGGIIDALDANEGIALQTLIGMGMMTQADYDGMVELHQGMSWSRGMKDGVAGGGYEFPDDMTPPFAAGTCQGYDCLLEWTFQDVLNGTNNSGNNPGGAPPSLAAVCLWGLSPAAEVPASAATVTGDLANDHPAYDAIPADPGMPPVREQAAASINELVAGMYAEFHLAAFGTTVPASNFSVSMEVGDPDGATAPAFTSIVIGK